MKYAMKSINEEVLDNIKKEGHNFGKSLQEVRKSRNISLRRMARLVNKTSAYLSDIENGNTKPPNNSLLESILKELSLEDCNEPLRGYLYDLAAIQRREAPDDIIDYLLSHGELRNIIRLAESRNIGDEFWKECARKL